MKDIVFIDGDIDKRIEKHRYGYHLYNYISIATLYNILGNPSLLLLTSIHNLQNYAIICFAATYPAAKSKSPEALQIKALLDKKEQTITMIKILFICHGNILTMLGQHA